VLKHSNKCNNDSEIYKLFCCNIIHNLPVNHFNATYESSSLKTVCSGLIWVYLLLENISEWSVHHLLSTVESNYFGIYQEQLIKKYQKCRANHELRLSCAGTAAAACFFGTRCSSKILSETSTFTDGKELPVEIWKGSWVGLKESVC